MTTDKPDTTSDETRPETHTEQPTSEPSDAISTLRRLRPAKVPKSAGTLLLVVLLLPFLLFAVPQVVGADHSFVILSGSMEPALSPGDVVLVSESASVQVGDVITFDTGDTVPVTHRIIGVEDGRYVTKGDANGNADGTSVPPANVLGRVVLTVPLVGYVILWANTPVGQILLVVVPLVALGVSWLHRWSKDDPEAGHAVNSDPAVDADRPDGSESAARDDSESTATNEQQPLDSDVTSAKVSRDTVVDAADTEAGIVSLTAPDLTLTLVSTALLAGYAAWNVVGEIGSAGVPEPVSIAVLTAGLLGTGTALRMTYVARRGRSQGTGTAAAETSSESTAADGGVDIEDST